MVYMLDLLNPRRILFGILIGLIAIVFFPIPNCQISYAHTPHNVVDALEISPEYDKDHTLYVIIQNRLLRSTNRGFSWKELVHGIDNKFVLSSLAVSPGFANDQTLFVSSDGDGVYKSQDGGTSWYKKNKGLGNLSIGLLAVGPGYPSDRIVLAAGTHGGLYKTHDGGEHWYRVIDEGLIVTAVAFVPDLNARVVVMGDDQGNIWFSNDKGQTWERRYQLPQAGRITALAISEQVSNTEIIFVGTSQGAAYKIVDDEASVRALDGLSSVRSVDCDGESLEAPLLDKYITSLALSPYDGKDEALFVATWYNAVYRSGDSGQTWKHQETGISCNRQADWYSNRVPYFRQLRISKTFKDDRTMFLAGFDGLFKSTDGGLTWMQLETLPVRLIAGLDLSPAQDNAFLVAITTYGGGAYTTSDQGVTWTINNHGLKTTRLSDIIFSPNYALDHTLFSASQERFLRSTQEAGNWEQIDLHYKGWRKPVAYSLRRMGVPPRFSTDLLLRKSERQGPSKWPMVIALSPNFTTDKTLYVGTRRHGVLKSVDGGLSWTDSWDGPIDFILSLVISPDFIMDKTLYAGVRGAGVFKSVDGGTTWQPGNNGFEFLQDISFPVSPNYNVDPVLFESLKDIRLAISPNYKTDKTLFSGSADGLFKTTNGAMSWERLEIAPNLKNSNIYAVAISPYYKDDETLIVSVKGEGLYKSIDGGHTFLAFANQLIERNYDIKQIEFSPLYPSDNTIYAASREELFRSTDGGNSWKLIPRPVRYENWRGKGKGPVKFKGSWEIVKSREYSATSMSHSDVPLDTAILYFVGTGVNWIGIEGREQGIGKVYVDGNYVADVDQFGDTESFMMTSFSVSDLEYGPHTIKIEVTDRKNPSSTGHRISIDAFDVVP